MFVYNIKQKSISIRKRKGQVVGGGGGGGGGEYKTTFFKMCKTDQLKMLVEMKAVLPVTKISNYEEVIMCRLQFSLEY